MDARETEARMLARCAAVARGDGAPAGDAREANVFRLAGLVVESSHPGEAARLGEAGRAFFEAHPQALLDSEEVLRKGWIISLPRLRDMLRRELPQAL